LELICENCGAGLEIAVDQKTAHCPYCRTDFKLVGTRRLIALVREEGKASGLSKSPAVEAPAGKPKAASRRAYITAAAILFAALLPGLVFLSFRVNSDIEHGQNKGSLSQPRTEIVSEPIKALAKALWGTEEPSAEELSAVTELRFSKSRTAFSANNSYEAMHIHYRLAGGEDGSVILYGLGHAEIEAEDMLAFSRLEVLDTGGLTEFTYLSDPTDLRQLTELRIVNLNGFALFKGAGMFADPAKIEHLALSAYDDDDIAELAKFPALKSLELRIGSNATDFTSITQLQVSELCVSGLKEYSWLRNAQKLKSLTIDCYEVTDFSFLGEMGSLSSLSLTGASNLKNLRFVSSMESLERLSIQGASSLRDLSPLEGKTGLKSLDIAASEVRDWSAVSTLTGLEDLSIRAYTVDTAFLAAGLGRLKTAAVYDFDAKLLACLAGAPLTNLTCAVDYSEAWDCEAFLAFGDLESLHVTAITSGKIENIAALRGLTKLKSLSVSQMHVNEMEDTAALFALGVETLSLSDSYIRIGPGDVAMENAALQSLAIDGVSVSVEGGKSSQEAALLTPFIEKMPGLRSLTMCGAGLEGLAFCEGLSSLAYLDVTSNYISDLSPLYAKEHLRVLYIADNLITDADDLPKTVSVRGL